MTTEGPMGEPRRSRTLLQYVRDGLKRAHQNRPVSFYLLLMIPVALLLGARMGDVKDDPRRFTMYLGLLFLFMGIVLVRAVMDFFDLSRRHFRERHLLFGKTLDDEAFLETIRRKRMEKDEEGR